MQECRTTQPRMASVNFDPQRILKRSTSAVALAQARSFSKFRSAEDIETEFIMQFSEYGTGFSKFRSAEDIETFQVPLGANRSSKLQ